MPVVPKRDLQVGMSGAPNGRVSAPQMKDFSHTQNQQIGQVLQGVGEQVGKIALGIQQEANSIRVQDATNQYTAGLLDLTYGKEGYTQIKGEAVMQPQSGKPLVDGYRDREGQLLSHIENTLGNEAQRRAFRAGVAPHQNKFNEGLYKHEAEQALAYGANVLRTTIATGEQVVEHNYTQPDVVEAALESMTAAYAKMKKFEGVPDEEIAQQTAWLASNVHQKVVKQALQESNPTYANAYLQQYGTQMLPEEVDTLQKTVKGELDIQTASNVVNGLFATHPDMTERDMLQAVQAVPDIAQSPERMALAQTDIAAKQRAKAQKQKEERQAALAQAQTVLKDNGGNWLALPISVRSAIPADMQPHVKAYAKSLLKPVKLSDASAYVALSDVDALTRMSDADFEMTRTVLSETDFDFYATQRAAYQEGLASGKGVKNTPAVLNMLEVNRQVKQQVGKKMAELNMRLEQASKNVANNVANEVFKDESTTLPTTPTSLDDAERSKIEAAVAATVKSAKKAFEQTRHSVIRQKVNKYLLSHQIAQGQHYAPADIQAKVGEFIADQEQDFDQQDGEKTAEKRSLFTVQLSDISMPDMLAIRNQLARNGVDYPTTEQILQAYLNKGDFQTTNTPAVDAFAADFAQVLSTASKESDQKLAALEAKYGRGVLVATGGGGFYVINPSDYPKVESDGETVGAVAAIFNAGQRSIYLQKSIFYANRIRFAIIGLNDLEDALDQGKAILRRSRYDNGVTLDENDEPVLENGDYLKNFMYYDRSMWVAPPAEIEEYLAADKEKMIDFAYSIAETNKVMASIPIPDKERQPVSAKLNEIVESALKDAPGDLAAWAAGKLGPAGPVLSAIISASWANYTEYEAGLIVALTSYGVDVTNAEEIETALMNRTIRRDIHQRAEMLASDKTFLSLLGSAASSTFKLPIEGAPPKGSRSYQEDYAKFLDRLEWVFGTRVENFVEKVGELYLETDLKRDTIPDSQELEAVQSWMRSRGTKEATAIADKLIPIIDQAKQREQASK